jgi:predicted RNase H-like nuclease
VVAQVAGVDGCRGGWIVVTDGDAFVRPDFGAVLAALDRDAVIGIDMPIGLLDEHLPGGRVADRAARGLLPRKRSSVFPAPARCCFGIRSADEARRRACRLNLQTINLLGKIEDVDGQMSPVLQERVYEVHPELSFAAMNDDRPVLSSKTRPLGRDERRALLERAGVAIPARPRPYRAVKDDDLLDACAARWSACRIAAGAAGRVPEPPPVDGRGLRMEIWW